MTLFIEKLRFLLFDHVTGENQQYKEKCFLQFYNNHFRQFCFQSEPEVKWMFYLQFISFFFHITMSLAMGVES